MPYLGEGFCKTYVKNEFRKFVWNKRIHLLTKNGEYDKIQKTEIPSKACKEKIQAALKAKTDELSQSLCRKYNVDTPKQFYDLRQDISQDNDIDLILEFAEAAGDKKTIDEYKKLRETQATIAEHNCEIDRQKEEERIAAEIAAKKAQQRATRNKIISIIVQLLGTLVCLAPGIYFLLALLFTYLDQTIVSWSFDFVYGAIEYCLGDKTLGCLVLVAIAFGYFVIGGFVKLFTRGGKHGHVSTRRWATARFILMTLLAVAIAAIGILMIMTMVQ